MNTINKSLLATSIVAGVLIIGGLTVDTAILNKRVNDLENHPVKVTIIATPTPEASTSATPTVTYGVKKISLTPAIPIKK